MWKGILYKILVIITNLILQVFTLSSKCCLIFQVTKIWTTGRKQERARGDHPAGTSALRILFRWYEKCIVASWCQPTIRQLSKSVDTYSELSGSVFITKAAKALHIITVFKQRYHIYDMFENIQSCSLCNMSSAFHRI